MFRPDISPSAVRIVVTGRVSSPSPELTGQPVDGPVEPRPIRTRKLPARLAGPEWAK